MIKKYCFILSLVFVVSCGKSDMDAVNDSITEYIKQNANDPSSYEAVETDYKNKVLIKDYAKDIFDNYSGIIQDTEATILKENAKIEEFKSKGYGQEIINISNEIKTNASDFNARAKEWVEKSSKKLNDTSTVYKVYTHKCRLKNKMGALTLTEYYVYVNNDNKIISFDEDFSSAREASLRDFESSL